MLQGVYVIYDNKLCAFMQPWFAANDLVATRSFLNLARDPATPVGANPEDFTLHKLADWNGKEGRFENVDRASMCAALAAKGDKV